MSQVEQPAYAVERAEGRIEIRMYPTMIVAEAAVAGDRTSAIRQGFQIIAGYIFGANVGSRKVEMTAPVMQQQSLGTPTGETIESTAAGIWKVRFVMPKKWSLDTLPEPRDQRVSLKAIPARKVVAIRFSGLARDASIRKETEQLSAFIAKSHMEPVGAPILAFFNPPWTLPPLRRNEVMIEVKQP